MIAGIAAGAAVPAFAAEGARDGVIAASDGRGFALGPMDAVMPLDIPAGLEWAVDTPGGRLALFRRKDGGRLVGVDRGWRSLGTTATGGTEPVHLAIDRSGRLAAVADYGAGSVSLHRIDRGVPGPAQIVRHEGRGPNVARQAGPHAHWVGFGRDGRWLYAVDLGADAVFAHRIERGALVDTRIAYQAPPGSGPRHIAWHPTRPVAYLASELVSGVTTLRIAPDGTLIALDRQSTLPDGTPGHAGHVAVDPRGRCLYVSNRGPNTIAMFALDDPLRPRLVQQAACGGDWPRFFLLRPAAGDMLVANERSGAMAVLPVGVDGRLGPPRVGPAVSRARFAAI